MTSAPPPERAPAPSAGIALAGAGVGIAALGPGAAVLSALGSGDVFLGAAAAVLGLMLVAAGRQLHRGGLPSSVLSDRIGAAGAVLGALWVSAALGRILGATGIMGGIKGTSAGNVPLIMMVFVGLPAAVMLAGRVANTLRSPARMLNGIGYYGVLTAAALLLLGAVHPTQAMPSFYASASPVAQSARALLIVLGLLHLALPIVARRLRQGVLDRMDDELDAGW